MPAFSAGGAPASLPNSLFDFLPTTLSAFLPPPFEMGWPVGVLAALIGLRLLGRERPAHALPSTDRCPIRLSPQGLTLWLGALLALGVELSDKARTFRVDPPPAGLTLESLAGTDVDAARALADGALLWRSDCAPCRERVTRLAARPESPSAPRYLINQGESLLRVIRYLDDRHPGRFDDTRVLLDPRQHFLALAGEPPLPFAIKGKTPRR